MADGKQQGAIRYQPTQASSSIWQSNGLQNRRLRVQFLPGLPGFKDTVSRRAPWGGVFKCGKSGQRRRGFVAKAEAAKKGQENAIVRYLRETWFELRKVSWPTRREAVNLTVIVIVVTSFLALVLSLMDWLFSSGFNLFL
jgi:preprotein translocase subunit SecE